MQKKSYQSHDSGAKLPDTNLAVNYRYVKADRLDLAHLYETLELATMAAVNAY